jgi:hypothetical protein
VELNAQGRARPSLAALYNWRYRALVGASQAARRCMPLPLLCSHCCCTGTWVQATPQLLLLLPPPALLATCCLRSAYASWRLLPLHSCATPLPAPCCYLTPPCPAHHPLAPPQGDLPAVTTAESFRRANAGFALEYQFVDVPDVNGVGETEPLPYFYQNLAEAEYLVRSCRGCWGCWGCRGCRC